MILFDAETDGLLDTVSKVHCINCIDRADGKRLRFNQGRYADGTEAPRDGSIEDGLELLRTRPIAGANIIKYDLAVLEKLYGFKPEGPVFDTRVASAVIWTNLKEMDFAALRKKKLPLEFQKLGLIGRNSVEAWGWRLDPDGSRGFRKGDSGVENNDWSMFTPKMDDYCAQDNEATLAWLERIESKNYSQQCLDLEMRVAQIIALQERTGVRFNVQAAEALLAELQARKLELEEQLRDAFPPWEVVTKDFIAKVNNKRHGLVKGERCIRTKQIIFNPGSRDHIADRFQKIHGWQPADFTPEGKPKVDEEILSTLPYPEAKPISKYLAVGKVLGMLAEGKAESAWLKAVGDDGRIHGTVNSNGAVTGRMTHSAPNLAQTPKVLVDKEGEILHGEAGGWGYECRALFCASEGLVMVGCDAEGLELRMLGHYMAAYDGGAYARAVVDGRKEDGTDVHTVNQKGAGLNTRNNAKTFIYALLYGAGDFKLGTIVYDDFTDAQKAEFNKLEGSRDKRLAWLGKARRAKLMARLPALKKLTDAVKHRAKTRGYLVGLDGRLLHVRSEHAALNTLLQSGGAVVMKRALEIFYDTVENTPALAGRVGFLLNVHDEFQVETAHEIAEQVGEAAAEAIRLAGERFNLRCPLAGAYAIGEGWHATH